MAQDPPKKAKPGQALPRPDRAGQKRSGSTITLKKPPGGPAATPRRNDPYPTLRLVEKPIVDLTRAPRRVRRADKAQKKRVLRSIERYGNVAPILVTGDGVVIDGHTRLDAAIELGAKTVPCIEIDHLSPSEIRQLRIALNKIQERGVWDEDALRLEFQDFLEIDVDLEILGFDAVEIDSILEIGSGADSAEPDPEDSITEHDGPLVTRPGDLWWLDSHRILCGNARSEDDLRRLCDDERAQMLFTDPPYNVPITGHVRGTAGGYREFAEASGEMSEEEFANFLTTALTNATNVLDPGSVACVFMDWRHMQEMLIALRQAMLRLINLCIWVKPNGGMGSLYRSRHELVFVAVAGNARHRNNVELGKHGRYRTNVWEYAGATGGSASAEDNFDVHPTVKPVALVADAILDLTAAGDVVLDPFLGSGTTLLAAERTRRRCLGLEIDPAYVDVAIRRWQEMTGGAAIHVASGRRFDDLAADSAGGAPSVPSGGAEIDASEDGEGA